MTSSLKQAVEKIAASQTVSLVIHQNPDGDAIGSAVALAEALKGKDVSLVCATDVAEIFSKIVELPAAASILETGRDCYIVLDCSESHRTGFARQLREIPGHSIIVLDHHSHGDLAKRASIAVIDPAYSATAEIVDDLLKELHHPVTPKIATALLLGIFTDSGGFKHPNTSQLSLNRASRLVRYGGDLQKINRTFLKKISLKQRWLWGNALANLEVNRWGIAVARIPLSSLQKAQASAEDTFGLANMLSLISEAKASLVFIEQGDGWRGILRTRHHQIDISRLAKLLGGRGQKKAAGFTATKKLFSGRIDT